MSNVLTGVVQITAPGVQSAFNAVAGGAKRAENAIQSLATKLKTSQGSFTIIGEAGQLTGSKLRSLTGVLNTTASQIPVLTQATKSASSSMLALATSLISPNTAFLLLAGAIVSFVSGLSSAKNETESLSDKVKAFTEILEKEKKSLDSIGDSIASLNRANKINIDINFGKGGDVLFLSGVATQLADEGIAIENALKNNFAKIDKLNQDFFDGTITDKKEFDQKEEALFKRTEELNEKQVKNSLDLSYVQQQIRLQQKNDREKAQEEDKASYEKYVNDIISTAKKYQTALGKGIDVQLRLAFNDTNQEEFQKSLDYLSRINSGKFVFTIRDPKIRFENVEGPELPGAGVSGYGPILYEQESKEASKSFTARTEEDWANWLALDKLGRALLLQEAKIKDAATTLAESFNSELNSAFVNGLASIGEGIGNILSGKKFGDGLTQAIGTLLQNLGKALIQFGVIKKFVDNLLKNPFFKSGAAVIAVGVAAIAIGTALKNISGARALGGPVGAGGTYLVGENGPELFTPNTGGQIVPNNWLGGRNVSGGGMAVQITGEFIQRGQDLLAVITLANQSKMRLQ